MDTRAMDYPIVVREGALLPGIVASEPQEVLAILELHAPVAVAVGGEDALGEYCPEVNMLGMDQLGNPEEEESITPGAVQGNHLGGLQEVGEALIEGEIHLGIRLDDVLAVLAEPPARSRVDEVPEVAVHRPVVHPVRLPTLGVLDSLTHRPAINRSTIPELHAALDELRCLAIGLPGHPESTQGMGQLRGWLRRLLLLAASRLLGHDPIPLFSGR